MYNREIIIQEIEKINSSLSIINSLLEKSFDEKFIADIASGYPFEIDIAELNSMFNAWKWDIKEQIENM